MSISPSKSVAILLLLGGFWWFTQREANAPRRSAATMSPEVAAAHRVMRPRLELAMTSAVNVAECGTSDVGYTSRTPDQAARHLVALMGSASAAPRGFEPPPGRTVSFAEGLPGTPWQVTVNVAPDSSALVIEGFGTDLSRPLVTRRVPCG